MKCNYHTPRARPQYRTAAAETHSPVPVQFVAAAASRPLQIQGGLVTGRPPLAGNREMLRALRAAEMEAWEAVRPSTKIGTVATPDRTAGSLWRSSAGVHSKTEGWLVFLVAACAAAAIGIGLTDATQLLEHWSQFARGIRILLLA